MNHLQGVFIVRKGRYFQICVLGILFGPKTENVCRNLHHWPKVKGNEAQSSVVGSASKMNHLMEYIVVETARFGQICVLGDIC
jgi:hypothetical protein